MSPAEVAQLVEHATENRGVRSSILRLGTCQHRVTSKSGIGSLFIGYAEVAQW